MGMKSLEDWKKELLSDSELAEKYQKDKAIQGVISIFLKYRTEHNLTQLELAEKIGTDEETVSKFEEKAITPSFEFVVNSLYELGYEMNFSKIEK